MLSNDVIKWWTIYLGRRIYFNSFINDFTQEFIESLKGQKGGFIVLLLFPCNFMAILCYQRICELDVCKGLSTCSLWMASCVTEVNYRAGRRRRKRRRGGGRRRIPPPPQVGKADRRSFLKS
jgi:hypothetical protein